MKPFSLILAVLLLTFSFTSCRHDDNFSTTNQGTNIPGVSTGLYKITLYFDDNRDRTSNYTTYTFEFANGGVLKAVNSTTTVTGTWTDGNRFNIAFSASPLDKLNDDWVIEEKTASVIKLKDDNTTKSERLYFTKQ